MNKRPAPIHIYIYIYILDVRMGANASTFTLSLRSLRTKARHPFDHLELKLQPPILKRISSVLISDAQAQTLALWFQIPYPEAHTSSKTIQSLGKTLPTYLRSERDLGYFLANLGKWSDFPKFPWTSLNSENFPKSLTTSQHSQNTSLNTRKLP